MYIIQYKYNLLIISLAYLFPILLTSLICKFILNEIFNLGIFITIIITLLNMCIYTILFRWKLNLNLQIYNILKLKLKRITF